MMNRPIYLFLAIMGLGFGLAQAQTPDSATTAPAPAAKDGLFVHLSSGPESPHRVLMALQLADKASAAGNLDVFIYFDIKGVEIVLQGTPEVNHEGFASSSVLLARLRERGVPMAACPACLKASGHTPDELLPGVKVASLQDFFGFTQGRILTLDY